MQGFALSRRHLSLFAGAVALAVALPGVAFATAGTLIGTGPYAQSYFGTSIAVSGDTAVVGGWRDVNGGVTAGRAHVYTRSGTTWSFQGTLAAQDPVANDYFGQSVAISGDTIVVGAPGDDTVAGSDAGSAWVFTRSGTTWSLQTSLTAGAPAAADRFGTSVAIVGDSIAVGAVNDDTDGGVDAGSAWVFTRSGTTWSQEASLTSGDGAAGDSFGRSVSVSGATLVVGANADDTGAGADAGSAYVFTRSGTTWSQQTSLTAGDGAAGDDFGWSVAVATDTILVGAQHDDTTAAVSAGSAYVFTGNGASWSHQAKLTAADAGLNHNFGTSVSLSGDYAVVGAPGYWSLLGQAYLFRRSGTTWTQRATLTGSDTAGDRLGKSVSIDGGIVVAGADGDDIGPGSDAGSAWAFTVPNEPPVAVEDSATISEDSSIDVAAPGVLANDSDAESETLTVYSYVPSENGTGGVAVDGRWYYTPDTNFNGSDHMHYKAQDATSQSGYTTITITVTPVNDAPVAIEDTYTVSEDETLTVLGPGLLANDTDVEGDPLTGSSFNDAATIGEVSVAGGGGFTYRAPQDWNGIDTFRYRCSDMATESAWATVTITVTAVNDPPVAVSDTSTLLALGKKIAADPVGLARAGEAVAIDGDTAVIGAPYADANTTGAGAAYVYVRSGTGWALQAKLSAPDGTGNSVFACAVDVCGDTVVVGSRQDSITGGAAYVFTRSGTTWSQQARLIASDSAAGNCFGVSVAISGDNLVVGASYSDAVGNNAGEAFTFRRTGGVWSQEATLTGSDTAANDEFGYSLDICGDVVLVGATNNDGAGSDAGAAYVFERGDGSWPQRSKVTASDAQANDWFGWGVALDEDGAVIGATGDDDVALEAGAVYAFERSGTTLSGQQKLSPSDLSANEYLFGKAVAIDGDTILVGRQSDDAGAVNKGSSYVFSKGKTGWSQTSKLQASDGLEGDQFGSAVAVCGADVLIGANYDDYSPTVQDAGSAYFYIAAYRTLEDRQLTVDAPGVLTNDYDVDSPLLGVDWHSTAHHGTLAVDGNGAFRYTPEADWSGIDRFQYTATDGTSGSATVTVTILVEETSGTVTRVPGADRYAVAAEMARKGWNTDGTWGETSHVIVACGEPGKEADPLAAAGLAGVYDAPILLVRNSTTIPTATRNVISQIASWSPDASITVHIVGGTASVPSGVVTSLRRIHHHVMNVTRVAGADRYAVTANIAKQMRAVEGTTLPGALIICAEKPAAFYDALAASPIAYQMHMPMLGVRTAYAPTSVKNALASCVSTSSRYAVSYNGYIGSVARAGTKVTLPPLANTSNRYAAAAQIATAALAHGWSEPHDVGVASKLSDSLGGGAFMGKRGGVLLYTTTTGSKLQTSTRAWVSAHVASIVRGWVFGGTVSVPPAQETDFRALVQ